MSFFTRTLGVLGLIMIIGSCQRSGGADDADEIVFDAPDSGPASACGPSTCASGEVCCNESCGICTPPGGFCTQMLCGPEAVPGPVEPMTPEPKPTGPQMD